MPNYQKLYTRLFNGITDALEELERMNVGRAQELLRTAQQETEEAYLEEERSEVHQDSAAAESPW